MSEAPYMPLWIGDYLADTQHLSTEQHGAYLLILMSMWRHGGTLPNDPAKLARFARLSLKKWEAIGADVMAMLTVEGDVVTQKRLQKERDNSNRVSQARRAAGARGNEAKSLKNNKQADAIANANGDAKASDCDRISLSYSDQKKEKKEESANALSVDADFDRFWTAYPKRPGNPRKPAADKFARKIRDGTPPEAIIRGAEAYARLMADRDPQFIAQAVTWLNQERWKDDHTPPDPVARPGALHGGPGGGRYPEGARPPRRPSMFDTYAEGKARAVAAERGGPLDFDEPAYGGRTIELAPAQGRA